MNAGLEPAPAFCLPTANGYGASDESPTRARRSAIRATYSTHSAVSPGATVRATSCACRARRADAAIRGRAIASQHRSYRSHSLPPRDSRTVRSDNGSISPTARSRHISIASFPSSGSRHGASRPWRSPPTRRLRRSVPDLAPRRKQWSAPPSARDESCAPAANRVSRECRATKPEIRQLRARRAARCLRVRGSGAIGMATFGAPAEPDPE